MAFTSGFYDSINSDRPYSALQFGEMFDGLINDGVYKSQLQEFKVTPGLGIQVYVGSGRAWFNHIWILNTALIPIDLTIPDLLLPRIDTVVLEVDTRIPVRAANIRAIDGYPSTNPAPPSISGEAGVYRYPLANVRVDQNASSITSDKITNFVGSNSCPWVTPILSLISIDNAYAQFNKQFRDWLKSLEGSADESVLVSLKFQLDEAERQLTAAQTQANSLQTQLDAIKAAM